MHLRLLLLGVITVTLTACGGNDSPDAGATITDQLAAIPGLTFTEQPAPSALPGYRFFVMTYDQPADHQNPGGVRFAQRLTLLHRSTLAPTVLFSSGYNVSTKGGTSEITRLIGANQLSVEHRFFLPSRPNPADWTLLNIHQAAQDHHRIVQAFKAIYGGRWLSTGGSKGGMTSVFHRRFFPDDVDGTVAYVAPIDYAADAVQDPSNRYFTFLDNVGPDPTCRQHLKDFQKLALGRRADLLPLMDNLATADQTSFTQILGKDKALEFAVEEMPFLFWQYGNASNCAGIPAATATSAEVFQFLDNTADLYSYSDVDIMAFLPYYHQSATELGYPTDDESYMTGLLTAPLQDVPASYIPAGIPTPAYSDGAMRDVQSWVKTGGTRILFIYGEYDPWSAGAFEVGGATDSFKLIVPAGNHGSQIAGLTAADRATALDAISRWSGVTVSKMASGKAAEAAPEFPHRRL